VPKRGPEGPLFHVTAGVRGFWRTWFLAYMVSGVRDLWGPWLPGNGLSQCGGSHAGCKALGGPGSSTRRRSAALRRL